MLELGAAGESELAQDVADMGLDGGQRDGQPDGDFGVGVAQADQRGHLLLTGGEQPPAQQMGIRGVTLAQGIGQQRRGQFVCGALLALGQKLQVTQQGLVKAQRAVYRAQSKGGKESLPERHVKLSVSEHMFWYKASKGAGNEWRLWVMAQLAGWGKRLDKAECHPHTVSTLDGSGCR